MDLNGISAIVTGGASGLGEATVRDLAQRGAKVVVVDMNTEKSEAVAKDVKGVFVKAAVANTKKVIAAVKATKDMRPLRAPVPAAGIGWAPATTGHHRTYEQAFDPTTHQKEQER